MTVVVAVVVVLAVLVVIVALRSRRQADPVDSFRRQIDTLSPEARRPTISQATPGDDVPAAPDTGSGTVGEPPPAEHGGASEGSDDDGGTDGA